MGRAEGMWAGAHEKVQGWKNTPLGKDEMLSFVTFFRVSAVNSQCTSHVSTENPRRAQNRPPQEVPLGCVSYFELKAIGTLKVT